MSIELSLEDVKEVAFHYGFELEVSFFFFFHYPGQLHVCMANDWVFAVCFPNGRWKRLLKQLTLQTLDP